MILWKRFVCYLLVFSNLNAQAISLADVNSYHSEKLGTRDERIYFYNEDPTESESGYAFDHDPNYDKLDGSGIDDSDIVDVGALNDDASVGKVNGGDYNSPSTSKGHGPSAKTKKDSEKTEKEKYQDFLAQTQRDLINETIEFDKNVSERLTDLSQTFSSLPGFTDSNVNSKGMHETFEEVVQNRGDVKDLISRAELEKANYTSHRKAQLNQVRERILSKSPRSPQQEKAKFAGLQSLIYSDVAYVQNKVSEGEFYYEIAVQLANVVADIIPSTSLVKDVYGLVVGQDLLTGEELTAAERALCGTFTLAQIAGTLYTAGVGAGIVAAGIKQIRNISKANAMAVRLSIKLAKLAERFPHRISIRLPGASKTVTLIGRDMDEVRKVAKEFESEGIAVRVFDGDAISKEADLAWKEAKDTYGKVPDHEIVKLEIFKENKEWIEKAVKEGHTILDAGDNGKKTWSIFYEMEKAVVDRTKLGGK